MDHLPRPTNARPLDLDVPLLAIPDLIPKNITEFREFPARHDIPTDSGGFITWEAVAASNPRRTLEDKLALIQSWLYFGSLAVFFGPRFRYEDFVLSGEGKSLITSARLTDLVQQTFNSWPLQPRRWYHWPYPLYQWFRTSCLGKMGSQRDFADRQCRILDQPGRPDGDSWARVLMSIWALLDVMNAVAEISELGLQFNDDTIHRDRAVAFTLQDSAAGFIVDQALGFPGWCRYQFSRYCLKAPFIALVYLAQIPRRNRRGSSTGSCEDSGRCTCFSFSRAAATFPHVHHDCQCSPYEFPRREMMDIIRDGGVALLKCSRKTRQSDDGMAWQCEYVRATPEIPYVAMSHVWADELGHYAGNQVHRCQLERIVEKIILARNAPGMESDSQGQATESIIYLWFDFLCIPQYHEDMREEERIETRAVQQVALGSMSAVYSWADFVLVFDSEVLGTSEGTTRCEFAGRLALSAWNSRYWTYHEQCVARRTVFQLDDAVVARVPFHGPLAIVDTFSTTLRDFDSLVEKGMFRSLEAVFARVRPAELADNDYSFLAKAISSSQTQAIRWQSKRRWRLLAGERFYRVWSELACRDTSVADDALPIMATLLDLDQAEVAAIPPALRMRSILASVSWMPLHMLLTAPARPPGTPLEMRDGWVPDNVPYLDKISSPVHVKSVKNYFKLDLRGSPSTQPQGRVVQLIVVGRPIWEGRTIYIRFRAPHITGEMSVPVCLGLTANLSGEIVAAIPEGQRIAILVKPSLVTPTLAACFAVLDSDSTSIHLSHRFSFGVTELHDSDDPMISPTTSIDLGKVCVWFSSGKAAWPALRRRRDTFFNFVVGEMQRVINLYQWLGLLFTIFLEFCVIYPISRFNNVADVRLLVVLGSLLSILPAILAGWFLVSFLGGANTALGKTAGLMILTWSLWGSTSQGRSIPGWTASEESQGLIGMFDIWHEVEIMLPHMLAKLDEKSIGYLRFLFRSVRGLQFLDRILPFYQVVMFLKGRRWRRSRARLPDDDPRFASHYRPYDGVVSSPYQPEDDQEDIELQNLAM